MRDRRRDQLRIRDGRERDPERAVGKTRCRFGRDLQGESRLSGPARTREREQPRAVEETKPVLYATVFVLLVLTFLLNVAAIAVRARFRASLRPQDA